MDHYQRNDDGDYSTLTLSQPPNSLSATSSTISILDSPLKTPSIRKRHVSSYSTISRSASTIVTTERNEEQLKEVSKIQKRQARPLGTCVRKCGQCRQFKHVLLAECSMCSRMIDVDLKDCRCQMLTIRNVIDHFICPICNSELTLDGYIICANRTCQTTLSALIDKQDSSEVQEKSLLCDILTNISYPKSTLRTVAVQVNTLDHLPSIQRLLHTIQDDENEESSSSSLSWFKQDVDWTVITPSESSDLSQRSIDSGVDASLNDLVRNTTIAFNSNQPTKLALQNEDEQQSQPTSTNDSPVLAETPKSPRCLAIMNTRKRHNRLSTLLTLQTNKTCQTQLSCLTGIDEMIKCEEVSNTRVIRTNNPSRIERQSQVDTIKGRFDDLCQVRLEIADRVRKDSTIGVMNDERILQALTDKDGQRWSELVDQLINEQSQYSPSEIAQQLLDSIEHLHTSEKLNTLTSGQLQRRVRYAMSQCKHIDETLHLQNNLKKTTKDNRSRTNSKRDNECNGRVDMAVTVRQIDKRHNRQSIVPADHNWKPYVDRLFDQGHSADEIQRLLREAAETTMQSDDHRLQDVFNYINAKAKQQKTKTTSTGIEFVATSSKTKSVTRQHFQPTKLFSMTKPNEVTGTSSEMLVFPSPPTSEIKLISRESSPIVDVKEVEAIKSRYSSLNTLQSSSSIQSLITEQVIHQKDKSIISLNKSEKEEYVDVTGNPSTATMYKHQSVTSSTEITMPRERSNDNQSDSRSIVVPTEQKTSKIQDVIELKTSQVSEASSLYKSRSPSTITIKPSNSFNDVSLISLEKQCINALDRIQDALDVVDNSNVRLHPYPSNTQSELNKLIDILELNLHKPDNINRDSIEHLITQSIELLNHEKKAIASQSKETNFRKLDNQISTTINLLQEYRKTAMPVTPINEDSSFDQRISNTVVTPSDDPAPLKRVEENIEQTIESKIQSVQLSSSSTLDLKQQGITSKYQETAGLVRCRPIPYTSSNEKTSTETLKRVLISSTESIPLKTKDLVEQSITDGTDLKCIPAISSKTESVLHDNRSQTKWLGSLLSKISDNNTSTSDTSSASSSLPLSDQNDKQKKKSIDFQGEKEEPDIIQVADEEASSTGNRSASSMSRQQHMTNIPEVVDDNQNTPYETNVVMLEEEHAISFIVPDQDFSIVDKQFEIAQAKASSKQALNSEGLLIPTQDIKKEALNADLDSTNTPQNPLSMTASHINNSDEKNRSISSDVNDEPQSIDTQSSSPSDVDISDQSDRPRAKEDVTSQEQSLASSVTTSEDKLEVQQKSVDGEDEEKISSASVPIESPLSKSNINTDPETNTRSSLNDQKDDKETKSILSLSSGEKEDEDLMNGNEPENDIENTSKASHENTLVPDGHAAVAASKIVNYKNQTNKVQLPISAQSFSISNTKLFNSVLNRLNDLDDTASLNKSLSSDNHLSADARKRSSTEVSLDVAVTRSQNNENEKSSTGKSERTSTNEFHTPTVLSPTHSIAQEPANTGRSPSQTTKTENIKDKKLTTPTPSSLQPILTPTTMTLEEDKHIDAPLLLIEQASRPATPLVETQMMNVDETSLNSISNLHDLLAHDMSKEDQRKKLNRNDDELQNDHTNSPELSNTSMQESSSFDDTARTPSPQLQSNEELITDKIDDQQSKTQITINRTNSRSKIVSEDAPTSPILTPHSSTIHLTFRDDVHSESKQQLEQEESNKTPVRNTKVKSSSNERNPNLKFENIATSERTITESDKSDDRSSVHSSLQVEDSRQDKDDELEKKNLSKNEILIPQSPSLSNKRSSLDKRIETKDVPDQIHSPSLPRSEDNNEHRSEDQKSIHIKQPHSPVDLSPDTKRADSFYPGNIKKQPITSTSTAVLPSSITNGTTQNLQSQISLADRKSGNTTSSETQESISVSAFNLAHLTDLSPDNRLAMSGEELFSLLGKSSTGDSFHRTNSKKQSSLTNSLTRSGISSPSPSIPKLLLKRSPIKQPSTTAQSMKPSTALSITDISTSSSNTVATDHLLSTHSTISDQEEVTSIQKPSKGNRLKNRQPAMLDATRQSDMLKKAPRPLQNQSLPSSKKKERPVEVVPKKFANNSLMTNSDLAYESEAVSDAWMKSHEDISQILIIDEEDERKPQAHERQLNKYKKDRINDGSRHMPFNLKARGNHQAYTVDSSRLPSIEQSCGEHHMKKWSHDLSRRPIIRLPVTQIEKFECGTIGPRPHRSSINRQLFYLPSIDDRHQSSSRTTESLTDRFYTLMSTENNNDEQAFESILNWQQQYTIPKIEQSKLQYMYLLDPSVGNTSRGRQYPLLADEIDMMDDPNACTIINKWAFADLVNAERQKFIHQATDSKKRSKVNKNFKICLRKRPLRQFEENVFKEVDIISIIDPQTLLLHIPSITVDNQVFIKNRKFKCDQTFDENCQMSTIYHSTLAPLVDMAIDGSKSLCLIGGGKYSGKNYLLHSLIDLFAFDLIRLLSTFDISIHFLGVCHNRIVDLLQDYSPVRMMRSMNWMLIPNDEFHLQNDQDIDYIACQIKKRRRFIHQLIQINFRLKDQSTIVGSLMIVMLASSQYVYTRSLCSHRRKFLINSLNRTILSFKRALLGIQQNPDRIRAAFNNDILTRLIQPYVFHDRSNVCYIGTLNPGHRHRMATKSTLELARNLRFCLKRINRQRRKREKLPEANYNNDEQYDDVF